MQLNDTACLITGASRGIGREVARELHRRGARVGLIARDRPALEALAVELGAPATAATADVTDAEALTAAVGHVCDAIGPIDVLVNNAGVGAYAAFLEEDPATFDHLMKVNFFGVVATTRLVLPGMVERRRGHIVNVASIAGLLGPPFESAYAASKFAVVGFTESLAAEVGPRGVHVSLVNPGPVRTAFTQARGVEFQRRIPRPLGAPRVARAVADAIEDDRFEQILPRWLRFGVVARALVPTLYVRGLVRSSRAEARRGRHDGGDRG